MSKRKKVWVTKYWATRGVLTARVEPPRHDGGCVYVKPVGPRSYVCGLADYAETRDEAISQVRKKKAARLASLRRQIAKIEAIDPEEAVPE